MVPNSHTLVAIADSNVGAELESGADAGVLKLRHFSTICITFAIKNATKAQNLVDLLQRQSQKKRAEKSSKTSNFLSHKNRHKKFALF